MFSSQDEFASKILQCHGAFVVHKVSRAGCTMSSIKACCESGKTVVILSPTIRILEQVEQVIPKITYSNPRIAPILSNPELCAKLELNPKLKFQFKKNCSTCEFRGKPEQCVFQNLLINGFDIYCLTYSKLRALQTSNSGEAKLLLEKLWKCDVFVFDESTSAVIRDIPTIEMVATDETGKVTRISERIRATFKDEFERVEEIISKDLCAENMALFKETGFWGIIVDLFLAQFGKINRSGVYKNFVPNFLPKNEMKSKFQYGWNKITKLTNEGKNTKELQDVFLMAFAEEIIVTCEDGTVKLTPRFEDALGYMSEFCQMLDEDKLILIVDSYQPSVNFDKVFRRPVKHMLWGENGDPRGTNRQQLIICDTAHWGALDFLRDKKLQRRVRAFVTEVVEFRSKEVLIVATNKKMTAIIGEWDLPKDVRVTWFRSDWMRGVSVEDRRIMVCIGGPYIPRRAYDASAESFKIESFAKDLDRLDEDGQRLAISKIIRLDDTRSEFINAIGRVKDPEAYKRSVVFTLGMKKHEASILLKQDVPVSIPNVIQPLRKGGMFRDGDRIARLWLYKPTCQMEDLALVARIISRTTDKAKIRASEIVPGVTNVVVEKAKKYRDELEDYDVYFVEKRGGILFYLTKPTLDPFLEENSEYPVD